MEGAWRLAISVVILAGCADHAVFTPGNGETNVAPDPRPGSAGAARIELARIDCHVDARAGAVDCGLPVAPAAARGVAAASGYATIGGQHRFARLERIGTLASGEDGGVVTLTFDVAIQNLTLQRWGTGDSDMVPTPDPKGIRVVFVRLPEGVVVLEDAEEARSEAIVGDEEQYFYQYDEVLESGAATTGTWRFAFPATLVEWNFGVLVHAMVPDVDGLTVEFAKISVGADHACGLDPGGRAYCWGDNSDGELGIGSIGGSRPLPTPVASGLSFVDIAAGTDFTCAIGQSGTGYCWGSDANGKLGDAATVRDPSTPWPIFIHPDFEAMLTRIDAGWHHACAVDTRKRAWCWGTEADGRLGNGFTSDFAPAPVQVIMTELPEGVGFDRISAGGAFTCALDTENHAWCWGDNGLGTLGNGTTTDSSAPVRVGEHAHEFVAISAGYLHACASTADGDAYCWGFNSNGRLGAGPTFSDPWSEAPIQVVGGHSFRSIAAGAGHTCGATTGGALYCWGLGTDGELGIGSTSTNQVSPLSVNTAWIEEQLGFRPGFEEVSASMLLGIGLGNASCARSDRGIVVCWGYNGAFHLLGDATDADRRLVPVFVAGVRAGSAQPQP